ncbi:MAG: peptidoglycan DD-metalloendopeptidase family protein [Candidatus Levybacteria bacterium]|nr:peptidoglycan DD-metalloendopeptidase family protein [Candidatus Levybacteria bacterium]
MLRDILKRQLLFLLTAGLLALFFWPGKLSAQSTGTGQATYFLRGTIYGENFSTPLFGANVALVNKKTQGVESQKTNSSGQFAFIVPIGEYRLNVIAAGYMPDTQSVSLTGSPITTYFILKKLQPNQPIVSSNPNTNTPGDASSGTTTTGTGQTSATSNCVITKVDEPDTSPSPPPECGASSQPGGSGGTNGSVGDSGGPEQGAKWRFPLEAVSAVHGIGTEMASYSDWYLDGRPDCWGDPVCHGEHAGLDMGIPGGSGSRVYAITDGTIIERTDAYCPTNYAGCSIQIRHSTDKYLSRYTHIDIASGINEDDFVKKGTFLGTIHAWGNDHLHFELRKQDKLDSQGQPVNVNPRNYYPALNQFPSSEGYYGNVRSYTARVGYPWQDDGRLYGEMYKFHPPCQSDPSGCWAH